MQARGRAHSGIFASAGEAPIKQAVKWIDDQLSIRTSNYSALAAVSTDASTTCPSSGSATCFRDNYTAFPVQLQFFQNAISGPDQLRQRVALAYSQIFVVSSSTLMPAYAIRNSSRHCSTMCLEIFGRCSPRSA